MSAGYLAKCGTKIRHPERKGAEDQRSSLVAAGKWQWGTSNVYGCNVCGHYHAGRIGRGNRGNGKGRAKKHRR